MTEEGEGGEGETERRKDGEMISSLCMFFFVLGPFVFCVMASN